MNRNDNDAGYVYILTNPSFREDWVKIGKSSRPVDVRSKELDNTAVPLPFEIFATMKTNSPHRWRLDYSRQIPPLLPRSRDTRQHQWDTCFRCISHSISENTQRHHRIRSSARHQHRHKRRWHTLQGAHKVTSHHTAASQAAHEITQVKAQAAAMNAATCAFLFSLPYDTMR